MISQSRVRTKANVLILMRFVNFPDEVSFLCEKKCLEPGQNNCAKRSEEGNPGARQRSKVPLGAPVSRGSGPETAVTECT